jgi:primosomal replication protein N
MVTRKTFNRLLDFKQQSICITPNGVIHILFLLILNSKQKEKITVANAPTEHYC